IEIPFPEETKQVIATSQAFAYGSMVDNFYILVSSLTFKEGVKPELKNIVENTIATMEKGGIKNMVVKEEEFTTASGKEGIKAYGTMDVENNITKKNFKGAYILLSFAQNGGFEQVIITYKNDDQYAEDMVER